MTQRDWLERYGWRALAACSSGFLARVFGTCQYAEIDAHIQAILAGTEKMPADLLAYLRRVA